MKRTLFFTWAICVSSLSFAQDDHKLLRDGVIMRDGKVFKMDKEGHMFPYNGDIEFTNGTKVNKFGDITFASGLKTKMHEGEVVMKNGNLAIIESKVKKLEGFVFKEGKVYEILPSDLRSFEGKKTITDSNYVTPEGKYYLGKSGKFIQLKEGEVVTTSGEVFTPLPEVATNESYVVRRDNVVIKAVNNKMAVVDVDYLFPNGIKVSPQGLVSVKEGVSFTLRSGEKLNSKGELYLNNEGLFPNGIVKRDGFVFLVKEGKLSQITEDYPVDSAVVTVKGVVFYPGKTDKLLLKDGDVLGLDGKLQVSASGCGDAKSKKDRFIIDHVMYREGKLFIVKDGETSLLTNDITLSDKSKVLRTGQIIKANGSKMQLREGQRIALSGEELPDEKPEEGSNPDKNYLTMLRGRMWLVTDGKPALLKEDYNIKNKMIVKIDGLVAKSDGSKLMLKENDRLSLDGVLIALDKRPQPGQLPTEYYIMKLSKMWVVKDGKPTKLEADVTTTEGAKVLLDGTVVKKDKQRFTLKEGDKVDSKGELLTAKQ